MLRTSMLVGALCITLLATAAADAQVGYYRAYRPDPYRELSQTGKYHGYWRDLGYGVNAQQYDPYFYPGYGVYPSYGAPYGYGGAPHGQIRTAPDYYHPPRNFPYQYRFK